MRPPDAIIAAKRDGVALSDADIETASAGIASKGWSDAQVGAFAMAVRLNGLSNAETVALTRAMTASGNVVDWSDSPLDGPRLDKHSTGGVGDKVSLMLAPMLAACGAYVPMISGRGLGHTGGTLDKLEAIPGVHTVVPVARFKQLVAEHGCAIVAANEDIAPADARLYAIRDVTACVDSLPLIVASILSKKLAAGLDALVLDVKCGSGAFMRTRAAADELAAALTRVANGAGLECAALVTDMNQVLGHSAGNALEVREAIEFLDGSARDARLLDVVLELGTRLLLMGKLANGTTQARERLIEALDSGTAGDRFLRMCRGLGAQASSLPDMLASLPRADFVKPVASAEVAVVTQVDVLALGEAVVAMGGGRRHPNDPINPSVGLSQVLASGEQAGPDQPLAVVHCATADDLDEAERHVERAFTLDGVHPSHVNRQGSR